MIVPRFNKTRGVSPPPAATCHSNASRNGAHVPTLEIIPRQTLSKEHRNIKNLEGEKRIFFSGTALYGSVQFMTRNLFKF